MTTRRDGPAALRQVVAALRQGRRFLVTSHPGPDGDAIGSTVAASLALRLLGREVVAFNPDPVPRRFRFLVGAERILRGLPGEPFDTTLVLDCSDERIFAELPCPPENLGSIVVVDHHLTPGQRGDVVYQDPRAAAVGVMLHRLFTALKVPITREMAEALFCSIMSDTGSFRYQNTDEEALQVAAALIGLGVDPWRIASRLYEDRPRCELELLARVLQTLELSPCGRAAALTVSEAMLVETGCSEEAVDGLINFARGVEGAEVAVLLRPGLAGVGVSLRSRGAVDVSRIAERFGGGGHHNAAGFRSPAGAAAVLAALFGEVAQILDGA